MEKKMPMVTMMTRYILANGGAPYDGSMPNLEPSSKRQHPEILSPVGSEEMLMAAIHNGADAVYLGMPGYNARARTEDFSFENLGNMIQLAHLYGVKVLVAFNILIFQQELESLVPELNQLLLLRPDGIIVQDLGLVRLIRHLSPDQVIHASTQMTVTHHRAIHLLEALNLKRFVLGREVSLDEMLAIRRSTSRELEVFVHGALCVAYSGQCLTSESFGGRSANRGQCAQSCRMPYGLVVDGQLMDLGDKKHLVSPLDLCGLDEVPELMAAGIDSFKIEGRYKSPEYVASVTSAYRKAVDGVELEKSHRDAMEVTFSRGFFRGWLKGVDHNQLVQGEHSSHRGLEIGVLKKAYIKNSNPSLEIESHHVLQKGDSLLLCSQTGKALVGGKIYEILNSDSLEMTLGMASEFSLQELQGQQNVRIFLNRSPALDKEWQRSFKDKNNQKKILIDIKIRAFIGEHLALRAIDSSGHEVCIFSESPLEASLRSPLDEDFLKESLGAWGGSCFEVKLWSIECDQRCFLSQGALRKCRQKLQLLLEVERKKSNPLEQREEQDALRWMFSKNNAVPVSVIKPELSVLIREPEQLDDLKDSGIQEVILDFKHGITYAASLNRIREMGMKCVLASTRIVKPGEERRLKEMLKLKPDRVLVRNLSALHFFKEFEAEWKVPWTGDFSLNVTNHLSADYLLGLGLDRICPSYDLNIKQLHQLLERMDPQKIELTVHQYMPSFHMEHCVFATFLSQGSSIADCGMVCRHHKVELKDEKGILHPLQADQECRNTMFNGVPQSIASMMPQLIAKGVSHFRVEALTESSVECRKKVDAYLGLLHGQMSGEELKNKLGLMERFGVTEGQLMSEKSYRDRKKGI
jgi:U32 family peptidase